MQNSTRRDFIGVSLAASAGLAFGRGALGSLLTGGVPRVEPMKILILGGTGFLGPATVEAALARGHTLTLFNRGKTEKRKGGMFEGESRIEKLYGNRDPEKHADDADPASPKGLESLKGRTWDAVIDNSGYVPRIVKASAEMLAPSVKHYTFISSVSVYKGNAAEDKDETDELGTMADPTVEEMGAQFENYGPLKALCEKSAETALPGRVANVRPGFIVGPGDPTDRFTYWPLRVSAGGEVLCGASLSDPVQFIDVRDLAAWLVLNVERNTTGEFNATGPTGPEKRYTWGELLETCKKVTGSDATFTCVSNEFIAAVPEQVDLTIWVPFEGESRGFHTRNCARAIKAGLTFRDPADTVKGTLDWFRTLPAERQAKVKAGMARDKEKLVLEQWHAKQKEGK